MYLALSHIFISFTPPPYFPSIFSEIYRLLTQTNTHMHTANTVQFKVDLPWLQPEG